MSTNIDNSDWDQLFTGLTSIPSVIILFVRAGITSGRARNPGGGNTGRGIFEKEKTSNSFYFSNIK